MKLLSLYFLLFVVGITVAPVACGDGIGRWIGNTFNYYDDSGDTYTIRNIGGVDLTYGSNGYEGTGRWIGNTYNYHDNFNTYNTYSSFGSSNSYRLGGSTGYSRNRLGGGW